jgi:hypothetical protein
MAAHTSGITFKASIIYFVIIAATPLVAGLQCCHCTYVGTSANDDAQCDCVRNPDRHCYVNSETKSATDRSISSVVTAVMGRSGKAQQKSAEDMCAIAIYGNFSTRMDTLQRLLIQAEYTVSDSCTMLDIDEPRDDYPDVFVKALCACRKDWCNCDPVDPQVLHRPIPPPPPGPPVTDHGEKIEKKWTVWSTSVITTTIVPLRLLSNLFS